MERILFINACLRVGSRTKMLADYLLSQLDGEVTEVTLDRSSAEPLYADTLMQRIKWQENGDFDHAIFENAKQLAAADTVVIAAPYWDLSVPAVLKAYLESVCICGITFLYSPEGIPTSLCRAKKLYFLTTAGGPILSDVHGCGYVRQLFEAFFGVSDFACVKAENLDIDGADVPGILETAKKEIDALTGVEL